MSAFQAEYTVSRSVRRSIDNQATSMTASILAIAAEFEKPYLDEWIAWHLDAVKYDKIYLISNNWTY